MDLIPGYNSGYIDQGYTFPDTAPGQGTRDSVTVPDTRQRSFSGDKVVILPRRLSETETLAAADFNGHSDRRQLGGGSGPAEWRVPPGPQL